MALSRCDKKSGMNIVYYGSPVFQVSNRSSGKTEMRMNDATIEGFCVDELFEEIEDGNNKKWKVLKDLDVLFVCNQKGGYGAKWRIYKNDSILLETDWWNDYDIPYIPKDYVHLSPNDILYFTTWHENNANGTYDLIRIIPVFDNKTIEYFDKEVLYYRNIRSANTSAKNIVVRGDDNYANSNDALYINGYNCVNESMLRRHIGSKSNYYESSCLIAQQDMTIKFRGVSSGGYSTKWRLVVNDVTVYETSNYVDYGVPIESSNINISKGDEIKIFTWHSNSALPTYEISLLELIK